MHCKLMLHLCRFQRCFASTWKTMKIVIWLVSLKATLVQANNKNDPLLPTYLVLRNLFSLNSHVTTQPEIDFYSLCPILFKV